MLIVLDTNEYVYTFGTTKKPFCKEVFEILPTLQSKHMLRIPRMIVEEVRRNLMPALFREFIGYISELTIIDEDRWVPFELGAKYETKGLKPADALIAAYTEWTRADVLVTENRHFLSHHGNLPFKVLTAERCLRLLKP